MIFWCEGSDVLISTGEAEQPFQHALMITWWAVSPVWQTANAAIGNFLTETKAGSTMRHLPYKNKNPKNIIHIIVCILDDSTSRVLSPLSTFSAMKEGMCLLCDKGGR